MTGAVVVRRARLYQVALPLHEPFALSGGTLEVRRSLIVELEDDRGAVGYGESAPFDAPFYSPETLDTARLCLAQWLLPRVVARPVAGPAELDALLTDGIRGNEMARAGVETAWWDLVAARHGVSLADLVSQRLAELGVREEWRARRDHVECGVALGIPRRRERSSVRRQVTAALAAGYRRVKLKICPGWDVEPVSAAQEVLAGDAAIPLTVDANGAYDPARHGDHLRRLDECGLLYIEQPFPAEALWDAVQLAQGLATPVCLDESLTSDAVARQVLAMGGPTVWNIKVQRVGGLEQACRMYAQAADAQVKVWGGTMPETGLGAQAILALGGHAGFVYPSDLEPSVRWFAPGTDLVELKMRSDGTMPVPLSRAVPDRRRLGAPVYEIGG